MTREEFIKRWPNFKPEEFACKCGECGPESGLNINPKTMDRLQDLRYDLDFPFVVTSGYRCPKHPEAMKKDEPGAHGHGQAVDIAVSGSRALSMICAAPVYFFTGVGVKQKGKSRFIHLDDMEAAPSRPRPWIWSY
ncbi:D-Ala-D-Ala carboxypeptidase family metallohydrolase [Vibrio sp. HN007]|uniref:D-Ala-D-Ala carboxypeptidase family metallohydrolase n=1 Tax=Vibrio iocasae TaxID=3098914 RepID=UPI0035D3F425